VRVNGRRVRAIFRKELREYRHNGFIIWTMAIFPLIFLIQPLVVAFALPASASARLSHEHLLLHMLGIPAIVPAAVAAYAVVGERQQGTLEPVLTTPIRRQEFLLGKALAALVPSVAIAYAVQRPGGPTQIRLGDHVEDHLTGGGHVDQLWAERPDPPADPKVQRAGAGHQPDIAGRGHPGAHGGSAEQPRDRTDPELERIFRAGLQSHAPFPLAHQQLGQAPQFIVAQRLKVDRVEWAGDGGFLGHRTLLWLECVGHQDR
jgi:hypothetical protein